MNPALFQRAIRAMALATRFSASVGAGVLLGIGLDHLAGSSPFGMLLCALAGMALGTWHLLHDVRNSFDESPLPPPDSDHPGSDRDRS